MTEVVFNYNSEIIETTSNGSQLYSLNIDGYAFKGCSGLTKIELTDNVKSIGSCVFENCTALEDVDLGKRITSIGTSAFKDCKTLTEIALPESITSLGATLFMGTGIKRITIPKNVKYSAGSFAAGPLAGSVIEEVIFEEGMKTIPPNICCPSSKYTSYIKHVQIPDGVTSIGQYAFCFCTSLTEVKIPKEMASIGEYAFNGCTSLQLVYFKGDAPQIASNAFSKVIADAYYPYNYKWKPSDLQDYGGTITWKPYEGEIIDTGIWMTIFSNVNEDVVFDGGHAFLNVENNTDQDVYIGAYVLKAQDDVYISGRGVLPDVWNHPQLTSSSGGVFLNTESLYDRIEMEKNGEHYYRNYAWYTVSIDEEDLNKLLVCILGYGTYSPTNNCTHFATKTWNSIVDDCDKVCETGSPFVLKNYLVDKFGAKTATELLLDDKGHDTQFVFCSDGSLMPWTLDTVRYINAVESLSVKSINGNSVTLNWESPKYQIGINQWNVTGLALEYTKDGGDTKTISLSADSTEKTITGLEYGTRYSFNIYGISDHRSTKAGMVTGKKNVNTCEATTERVPLPGATSKVTCTNVASGIKVSWEKVTGATSYYVYRDNKQIFKTSALAVTDKEVKYNSGTKYVYKVVATAKNVGDSPKARTATMYRLMPVGIKALTNPSAGKMTVTYDKANGSSGYVVRYGLKSDMSDAKVITIKGQNTLSRTFSGMKKGKIYYVQVRTYKLVNGVRYYSGYCTTKTITIKK